MVPPFLVGIVWALGGLALGFWETPPVHSFWGCEKLSLCCLILPRSAPGLVELGCRGRLHTNRSSGTLPLRLSLVIPWRSSASSRGCEVLLTEQGYWHWSRYCTNDLLIFQTQWASGETRWLTTFVVLMRRFMLLLFFSWLIGWFWGVAGLVFGFNVNLCCSLFHFRFFLVHITLGVL